MESLRPLNEKLSEMEESIRREFLVDVVLIQNGCFYEAYGESAETIGGMFEYEIFERLGFGVVCGFPPIQLEKCVEDLEASARRVAVVEQVGKSSKRMQRELRYLSDDPILNFANLAIEYLDR